MQVTIVANGITSMTIGDPSTPIEEAALRMVQEAIDLDRARLRRSPEGIVIQIEERKAGV